MCEQSGRALYSLSPLPLDGHCRPGLHRVFGLVGPALESHTAGLLDDPRDFQSVHIQPHGIPFVDQSVLDCGGAVRDSRYRAAAALALRPVIEIHDSHLRIGRWEIAWDQIRRLDQTGWNVPLLVYLTLRDGRRVALIFPGDVDSSASLLRHLRRSAHEALLDGVPYRQFWGEPPASAPARMAPLRYPLLRPEDEEEVERMFQRLKSVGHLEQRRDVDEE